MKKIVPFKKDITLENNIAGITSISLEHTLEKQDDNTISGDFIISGAYKMTTSSINLDNFEYKLPVNISIDKKYDTKNVTVDINDFYYEVINDRILSINIEVALDDLEEREVLEVNKETEKEELSTEPVLEEERDAGEKDIKEDIVEENQEKTEEISSEETNAEEVRDNEVKSIFSGLSDNDNYVVYKIHVVTENDTIESIMEEYQVAREYLDAYNDLANIKIGDKLIIAGNGN